VVSNLVYRCLQVVKDEAQYSKYLSFKQRPLSKEFQDMALMSYVHPNVLCRLCEYANI
jgi:hypothetical protein